MQTNVSIKRVLACSLCTAAAGLLVTTLMHAAENHRIKLPGPAVQDLMLGTWAIKVHYEPSAQMPHGEDASGREVWRVGPAGQSLIEEYSELNTRGGVTEFAIAWWDEEEHGQRFLACDTDKTRACKLSPSVAKWEGNSLVYTEEGKTSNGTLIRQLIFQDITPTSFLQVMKEGPSIPSLKTIITIRAKKISDHAEPTMY